MQKMGPFQIDFRHTDKQSDLETSPLLELLNAAKNQLIQ